MGYLMGLNNGNFIERFFDEVRFKDDGEILQKLCMKSILI